MKSITVNPVTLMFIISALMILVGVLSIVLKKRKSGRCSVSTQATVVEVCMSRDTDDSGKQKTSYYPILEFEADGQPMRTPGNVKKNRSKAYQVGQVYGIRYNPKKPKELLMDNGKKGYGSGIVIILIGLLIAGVCIASLLKLF